MNQWRQYLFLEIKRAFLSFPGIFVGSFLLLALLSGILAFCQSNAGSAPVTVAVVAAEDEPFVDWMITTVGSMETTEYLFTLERMDEDTAERQLRSGKAAFAFLIPEGYIASIVHGENKPVTIRTQAKQTTMVSFLFRQLCEAASTFILSSEAGIYSMQEYYDKQQLPNQSRDELELNLQYILEITELQQSIEQEKPESIFYSTDSRYFVSALVLFLLLQGLSYGKLLTSQNHSFQRLLTSKGLGCGRQLLSEGLTLLLAGLIQYLLLFLFAGFLSSKFSLFPKDTICAEWSGLWRFSLYCLPLLISSTSIILLIYELAGDMISGAVFLTLFVLLLGLCSGCFYPLDALPQTVQHFAGFLPVYHCCQYALGILYDSLSWHFLALLIVWFCLCAFLVTVLRKLRCTRYYQ